MHPSLPPATGRNVRRTLLAAGAVLLLGAADPARSEILSFTEPYAHFSDPLSGAGSQLSETLTFRTQSLFPSALGDLESMNLQFSGIVIFSLLPGKNVIEQEGIEQPIPYAIFPQLEIELSGPYGLVPIQILTSPVLTDGTGVPTSVSGTYSFNFTYLESLGGFSGPNAIRSEGFAVSLPQTLTAQLDDFLSDQAPTDEVTLTYRLSFAETVRASSAPTVMSLSGALGVVTNYFYSPRAPGPEPGPDPVAVPEPGTGYLLFAGCAALLISQCAIRTRRSRRV